MNDQTEQHKCVWTWEEMRNHMDIWKCHMCGETIEQPADCPGGR